MRSLSARLLLLTVSFVMLAEVLIFAPSIGRYRLTYFETKLDTAHLAIRALDATPDGMVSEELEQELLRHVGAYAIAVKRGDVRQVLAGEMPPMADETVRMSEDGFLPLIAAALEELATGQPRILRVVGSSPKESGIEIEILIDSDPLKREMIDFAWRIFLLSVVISAITATLVFLSLQWLLVRPMRRITGSMMEFSQAPEDGSRIIQPSGRTDEIGMAEAVLADMQRALQSALGQQKHLAALGAAVAKINHDLRGILSTALLVSDRLDRSDDPDVRTATPLLFSAIDRAVALCSRTLDYVREGGPELRKSPFRLAALVAEVLASQPGDARLASSVPDDMIVQADRDELFRILANLTRNAVEAGASEITLTARQGPDSVELVVSDNGPGLPERARDGLFKPFQGSARIGGTGLGLAIAREIAVAHGGNLSLLETGDDGTTFLLTLPRHG